MAQREPHTSAGWEPFAGLAAWAKARSNRAVEAEAVELLAPKSGEDILVAGSGPGVAVALLADRKTCGRIIGIETSASLMRAAVRRNQAYLDVGCVDLVEARADAVPLADGSVDGLIAIDALAPEDKVGRIAREFARVLRPGGRLVSMARDVGLEQDAGQAEAKLARAIKALELAGFFDVRHVRMQADKGRTVALTAARRLSAETARPTERSSAVGAADPIDET
ncbi:MAG: methyltransferase domain-containing protein [Hyphomonadaceae bacterium]